ncbi:MAG: DUF308 domain-containing protein [Chloroflexi bacterium]|nr:DUF308 domain-containing protein [Chloroflexota bacterium]
MLRGVAILLLGLFAIAAPKQALFVMVQVIGLYLLIDGVITSLAAFRGRGGSSRMVVLGRGALSIIGGCWCCCCRLYSRRSPPRYGPICWA